MKPIEPDIVEPGPAEDLDDRDYVRTFYERAVRIEDALGEPPSISNAELAEFLRALGLSPESIGRRSIRKNARERRSSHTRIELSRKQVPHQSIATSDDQRPIRKHRRKASD